MTALRVVIADDEPLARLRLRRLLGGIAGIEIAGECANGVEVMQLLHDCPCDLLFLDIHMPGADGFHALEQLPVRPGAVVFVTAHAEHAVRAFDVQAVDYLLKPISAARLEQAVARARRALVADVPVTAPSVISRRLALPIGRRMQMVELDELDCAIAQANYVELKVGTRSFVLRDTISGFHTRLDPLQFLRIHRSAIVRIGAIREVEAMASGRYRVNLHSGLRLICGRSYRDAFRAALGLTPESPPVSFANA